MPGYFWLFIIGLIFFLISAITYESTKRQTLSKWAGALLIIGVAFILISAILYLSAQRMLSVVQQPSVGVSSSVSRSTPSLPSLGNTQGLRSAPRLPSLND